MLTCVCASSWEQALLSFFLFLFFSLVVDIACVILFLPFLFDIVYFSSYFCVKGDENVLGYLYVFFLLLFLSHEDLLVLFISLFSLPSF